MGVLLRAPSGLERLGLLATGENVTSPLSLGGIGTCCGFPAPARYTWYLHSRHTHLGQIVAGTYIPMH